MHELMPVLAGVGIIVGLFAGIAQIAEYLEALWMARSAEAETEFPASRSRIYVTAHYISRATRRFLRIPKVVLGKVSRRSNGGHLEVTGARSRTTEGTAEVSKSLSVAASNQEKHIQSGEHHRPTHAEVEANARAGRIAKALKPSVQLDIAPEEAWERYLRRSLIFPFHARIVEADQMMVRPLAGAQECLVRRLIGVHSGRVVVEAIRGSDSLLIPAELLYPTEWGSENQTLLSDYRYWLTAR